MEEIALERLMEFLRDDVFFTDVTTEALIPRGCRVKAIVLTEEEGIIAGNRFIIPFLKRLNLEVAKYIDDGEHVEAGIAILEIMGEARTILTVERTVLNFLSVLSGIATYTRRLIEKVRRINSRVIIAATRKTHPGLTFFEKYAVAIGGGSMHRFGLFDMVLIKDNHIAIVRDIKKAVETTKKVLGLFKKVEVEVRCADEALEAAIAGADIIMLDNVSPREVAKTIELLHSHGLRDRVLIEVSGGIDETSILEYAKLDVDIISLSKITLGAPPLKMKMEIVEVGLC